MNEKFCYLCDVIHLMTEVSSHDSVVLGCPVEDWYWTSLVKSQCPWVLVKQLLLLLWPLE